jgi:hypothetical protein
MADDISAQVLAEVIAVRGDIAQLRVDLATHGETVRAQSVSINDHETRLRAVESADVITRADLERAAQMRIGQLSLIITAVGVIVGAVVAVVIQN